MHQSSVPSLGGLGYARRGRRALATGTALALSVSLMGLTAPGAHADPIAGGNWSTSFESGQPQPLRSAALTPAQNVNQIVPNSNIVVDNVFGTDANTGAEGAHRIIDPTGVANADKWFVGRKPSAANPIQAIYTLRAPTTVSSYQIVTGGDDRNRDPKAWNVYGSNEAGVGSNVSASSWELIDTVTNQDFVRTGSNNTRYVSRWYDIDDPAEYAFYKIEFTDNWASSNQFQVGAWLLHTDTPRFDYSPHSKIQSAVTTAPNVNNRAERVHRLWDSNPGTKWRTESRDYGKPTPTNPVYVMYTLEEAASFDTYLITSANDQRYPGQTGEQADPDDWTLFGTNDAAAAQSFLGHLPYDHTQNPDNGDWGSGTIPSTWLTDWQVGDQWQELDKVQDNGVFPLRRQQQAFQVDSPGAYKYVLMRIESSVQTNYMVQMSELSLVNAIPGAVSTLSTEVVDGRAYKPSGSNMLRYSGKIAADGAANATNTLFADLDVNVGSNTAVTYSIQPTSETGKNVLVDVEIADADGSNAEFISGSSLVTVNGDNFTTSAQSALLTANQWNTVTVDLSASAGKVVKRIALRYADDAAAEDAAISGFVRDIAISDSPLAGELAIANAPQTISVRANAPANKGLGVATGSGVIDPSSELTATIDLNNGSTPIDLVTTASSSGAAITFDAQTRIAVPGTYSATVTVTLGEQTATHNVSVVVVGDESVQSAFGDVANMVCTTAIDPADQHEDPNKRAVLAQADCDGNGRGYNRAALATPNAGVPFVFGQNGQFELAGEDFFFSVPNIPLGSPDAIIPSGQRWDVNVPANATQIAFLGAGNEGTKSRTIEIVYADGTKEPLTITFADWSVGSQDPIVAAGNTIVTESMGRPHRDPSTQSHDNLPARIYSTPAHDLAVDGNGDPKQIDYIQLPQYEGQLRGSGYGQIRFFGFATEVAPQDDVVAPQVSVETVDEQTVTQAFSAALATFTGGQGPFSATINWGDGSALDTGVLTAGTVNGTHTYAAAGTYSAVVTVTGNGASAAVVVKIEVARIASDVSLTGPSVSASNSGEVITATVAPAAATGKVQFSVAGQNIGEPVDLNADNEATIGVAALNSGANTVTATYLGDDTFAPSSDVHDVTVTKASSSIMIAGSGTFVAGQTLPIHVTVTPAEEGRTVNITLNGETVSSGQTNAEGKVSIFVSPPVGTTTYGAAVVESVNYQGATAPDPVVMTLNKHNVPPVLSGPTSNVEVGTMVYLTAAMNAQMTGSVQFKNGTQNLGNPIPITNAVALFNSDSLPAGTYSITAVYAGDNNFEPSVSSVLNFSIVKKTSSVSLAVPTADVLIGNAAAVTASVPTGATGSVTFLVDGQAYGSPVAVANNAATLSLTNLPLGSHKVVAQYSGDGSFGAATSAEGTFSVVKRAGSVTLATATPDTTIGTDVVVTATVPAGATGTVTFSVNGVTSGTPVAVANGSASLTLAKVALGSYNVTASYSGDGRFTTASTSQPLTISVAKKPVADDDFVIDVPSGSIEVGSQNALTVELPADATGSVSFTVNGGSPVVVPVVAGKASLPTSSLPAGDNEIVVAYSGDGTYAASTPQTVTIKVAKLTSTVSLSGPSKAVEAGSDVVVTATVSTGATGQVQFYVAGQAVGNPIALSGQSAKVTLKDLAAGRHTVTAKYLGDDTYESANSADLVVVVNAKPGASITVGAPVVSKSKQVFDATAKQLVTVTAPVSGVTSGTVTFRSAKTAEVLGTASVTKSGATYQAVLRLKPKLAVDNYGRVTASITRNGVTVTSGESARTLRVVKARPKKVTVRTKRVAAGTKIKVKVKVAKLNNGRHANGRIQIRVGKKVIGSVRITPKAKGQRTVTVNLNAKLRAQGSLKVRAKLVPKNKKSFKARQSAVTTIRLVR